MDLDDDTAAAIERVRRERGLGLSEAVNELLRQGLVPTTPAAAFRQRTHSLGVTIDVSNVAEALDIIEGPLSR